MKPYYFISVALSILAVTLFVVMFSDTFSSSGSASVNSLAGYFTGALVTLVMLLLNGGIASLMFWRRDDGGYAGSATIAHVVLVSVLVFFVVDAIGSKPSPNSYQKLSKAAAVGDYSEVKSILEKGHVSKALRLKSAMYDVKKLPIIDLFIADDEDLLHPLFCNSVYSGEQLFVEHYLKKGADVEETCTTYGVQPVFLVQNGSVLRSLIGAGARLDARNAESDTAFIQLIFMTQLEEELKENDLVYAVKKQPEIAKKGSDDGFSPLMMAIRENLLVLAQALIERGADVNQQTSTGETAMFLTENAQAVKFLLQQGASLDHQNNKGETPLSVNLLRGKGEAAIQMVNSGANVHLKDENGNTVEDLLENPTDDLNRKYVLQLRSLLAQN